MDSAKAEELLAGLGFNVDEQAPSPSSSSTERPKSGRRRKRPGDSKGIRSADWATTAPGPGDATGKEVRIGEDGTNGGVQQCRPAAKKVRLTFSLT